MWLGGLRGRWFGKSRSRGRAGRPRLVRLRVRELEARLTPSLITLGSFDGADGKWPEGGVVVDSAGNVYGSTYEGAGPHRGPGAVFEVVHGSGQITDVAQFGQGGGLYPVGGVVADSSGDLYGTSTEGGPSHDGVVWELASGGTLTKLASFNGANGSFPAAPLLIDGSGNLYGTTEYGGASGDGTVFEVAHGFGMIITLASFDGTDGASPLGALTMDSSGNLYGTTSAGGASGDGTVFEVALNSGTITTLASFDGNNGSYPDSALVMDSGGNLYGGAGQGGASGDGTLFEVAQGSGTITTLASFNGSDGTGPNNLLVDSYGDLYGTTVAGGTHGVGTVFAVPVGSNTITTLASFSGRYGNYPSGLTMDGGGNLFGVARRGGAYGDGTVFELPGGAMPIDQWTGANAAVDTNWSDGANWSLGKPPTAGQTALFTDNALVKSFTATVDAGFSNAVGGLVIDGTWGGTITVNSPLTVASSPWPAARWAATGR